ncbi:MAG: ATP-binding protein [Methylococcales bacterium]|nr:ATP-binding protein [Methylococcales bacterium]
MTDKSKPDKEQTKQHNLLEPAGHNSLDETEDRFRIMADHAPVMIWMAGLDKLCTFFNLVWLNFTGRTLDQEIGNGWAEAVHPHDYDRCLETYVSAFDARKSFTMEYRLRRSDGEYRWFIDNGIPHYNAQGEFLGYLGSCIDINDRKYAEQLMIEGRREAEHANQIKSQFLAMMSHEIRTPLNAILGILELLTQTSLDNRQLEYLNVATLASNNLLVIVNDILDLTKVESGMLELEHINFDVIELTHLCVRLMMGSAKVKGLKLGVFIEPEVSSLICGDPLRFKQVLLNLLNNAIKFTLKGSVTVVLSKTTKSATDDECVLLVEVIDTGIGISPELQSGLFEVFVQADPSDTRKYGGSGLGLAISKRLVTLWGGTIGLDSSLNEGSRFWFSVGSEATSFKITITHDSKDASKETVPAGDLKASFVANILLVDDSVINQAVLSSMLTTVGHQVDLVGCGADAIKAISDKEYDLILMDVSMPDMSGLEATTIIRQLAVGSDIPIIAVTAHALAGYQDKCLAAGMNGYLTKPISQKDLLSVVNTWCAVNLGAAVEANTHLDLKMDDRILSELTKQFGQQRINELLLLFLTDLSAQSKAVKSAVIQHNILDIERELHTIKSSATIFGAIALQEKAMALEIYCKNKDLSSLQYLVDDFLICVERTSKFIKSICKEQQQT